MNPEEEHKIDIDGVFIEIGWLPNTDILDGFVALNEKKEIIVDINCHTSMAGVFAAGDVTSIKGKQIIIASGEGAKGCSGSPRIFDEADIPMTKMSSPSFFLLKKIKKW